MLKHEAILATFETLSLDERRKLITKLAAKSNLVVNYWVTEEENIFREQVRDVPDYFLNFLFSSTSERRKIFYFKEYIQKAFRLFLLVKEKCNYASWKRSKHSDNTFCLAYKPGVQTWELKIIEENNPIFPGNCVTDKQEFFDELLKSISASCYVCLLYKNEFNYYQSFYDLATDKDEYRIYRKKWKLPKYLDL